MNRFLCTIFFIFFIFCASAQSYVKLVPILGDTSSICNNSIEMIPYGGTVGPYMITWWDNHWQPSTGLHAENICEGTIISTELVDMNCRHLRNGMYIFPSSIPQVYLDTIMAILPSAPGMCDGSISFHFRNVSPSYTRKFGNGSSGGTTLDSVFTNLCEGDYTYSIYGLTGSILLGEVSVSLRYAPVLPCAPFTDSLIITNVSSPGMCDGTVTYNSSGSIGSTPFHHYIYKPVGGGSVQINPSPIDMNPSFNNLCSGPHIVQTYTFGSNNYFVSSTIFVDDPLISDSTWGNPGAGQIDTVYLSAITNCGINYTFNIDTVYISNMNYIASNQFEFEITVIQTDSLLNQDTILNYETAFVDTSNQLLFDITFFCADSSSNFKTVGSESHNYIYFPSANVTTAIEEDKVKFSLIGIFPNPANNDLMISNLPSGKSLIKILSVDGAEIGNFETSDTNYKLALKGISSGFYFLLIQNGDEVSVKKFVVNKE